MGREVVSGHFCALRDAIVRRSSLHCDETRVNIDYRLKLRFAASLPFQGVVRRCVLLLAGAANGCFSLN